MQTLLGWIVAYLCRWLPHGRPPGLVAVGTPDEDSPVLVTCNFSLTVKRVKCALRGTNVWLLAAPSDGINVWCAACGGVFTHNRVIDAIKGGGGGGGGVSGLADKVKHHTIVLPALSAPAMDRQKILDETGFRAIFGPARARFLPDYLAGGMEKTEAMRCFPFGLRHRLDMLVSMNLPIYLLLAALVAIFAREHLLLVTGLFWLAVLVLYVFNEQVPGKTGWAQAFWASVPVLAVWIILNSYLLKSPLAGWGWYLAIIGIFFTVGFDLAGIVSARRSDAEALVARLGIRKLGSLYNEKNLGTITLDRNRCAGCLTCWDICPLRVYGERLDADGKILFRDASACFRCGACTKQCPRGALHLG